MTPQILTASLPNKNYLVFENGKKTILEITNMDVEFIKISLQSAEKGYQIKGTPNFTANLFYGIPGEGANSFPFSPTIPATMSNIFGTDGEHIMYIKDFKDLPKGKYIIEFEFEKSIM